MLLRVIDFETTGTEPPEAEVIEAAFTDVLDGKICATLSEMFGVDRPCPPHVRAIHHIAPADYSDRPRFDPAYMADLVTPTSGEKRPDVYVAHNIQFEERFFPIQNGICTYKAAIRLFPDLPSHSNFSLFYWFLEQGWIDADMTRAQPAHRAGPDTYATACNLLVMLERASVEQLVEWTKLPRLMTVLNFGKHRGMKLSEVPYDYLTWLAFKSDMDEDTKWNAKQEIDRRSARR